MPVTLSATRDGFTTAFAACGTTNHYWVKGELQLNLDYNEKIQKTNRWFNALVKDGTATLGIAGIGISVDA